MAFSANEIPYISKYVVHNYNLQFTTYNVKYLK